MFYRNERILAAVERFLETSQNSGTQIEGYTDSRIQCDCGLAVRVFLCGCSNCLLNIRKFGRCAATATGIELHWLTDRLEAYPTAGWPGRVRRVASRTISMGRLRFPHCQRTGPGSPEPSWMTSFRRSPRGTQSAKRQACSSPVSGSEDATTEEAEK